VRLAVREAFLAFQRAPLLSVLSVMTIGFSLFAFGLFGLVALNIRDALDRGLAALAPGVRAGDLDVLVRDGLDYPHHTGHGVGPHRWALAGIGKTDGARAGPHLPHAQGRDKKGHRVKEERCSSAVDGYQHTTEGGTAETKHCRSQELV